jgi:hypothetical protein
MGKQLKPVSKLAGSVVVAGVVAAAMLPTSAFALTSSNVTTSGTTNTTNNAATSNVYLFADQTKLTASVPTSIYIMVNSGGSLTCPTVTLKNGSLFSIKMSSLTGTVVSPFTIGGSSNILSLTLTPTTGDALTVTGSAQSPSTTAWTIANNGSTTVTPSGTLSTITADLGSAKNALKIAWTFTAA